MGWAVERKRWAAAPANAALADNASSSCCPSEPWPSEGCLRRKVAFSGCRARQSIVVSVCSHKEGFAHAARPSFRTVIAWCLPADRRVIRCGFLLRWRDTCRPRRDRRNGWSFWTCSIPLHHQRTPSKPYCDPCRKEPPLCSTTKSPQAPLRLSSWCFCTQQFRLPSAPPLMTPRHLPSLSSHGP